MALRVRNEAAEPTGTEPDIMGPRGKTRPLPDLAAKLDNTERQDSTRLRATERHRVTPLNNVKRHDLTQPRETPPHRMKRPT